MFTHKNSCTARLKRRAGYTTKKAENLAYHYKLGRKIFITALVIASHRCSTHLVFCMTILHISISIVLGVWLGNVIFKYTLITSENAFICIRLHKITA